MVSRNCERCAGTFNTHRAEIRRGRGRFCSKSCALSATRRGADNPGWKGGRVTDNHGYVRVLTSRDHAHADRDGYVLEHILKALDAMKIERMPDGAEVHHFNEDKADNSPGNLVVCQDRAYHALLHARQRIKNQGGDPNRDRICCQCGQVLPIEKFQRHSAGCMGVQPICRECAAYNHQAKKKGIIFGCPPLQTR